MPPPRLAIFVRQTVDFIEKLALSTAGKDDMSMRVAKRWEDHFAACIYCLSLVIGALLHLTKLFYEPVFDHKIGVIESVQCIHFVAAQTQHSLGQYAHKCLYIFYKHSTNDDFKFLDKINFFTPNRQKNINFTGKLYSLQMRFGLIGKHLSHSFSKRFFEDYFVHNRIDAHYDNIELANIADFEAVLARQEYSGFNVTNPYKIEIMRYLTALDETARSVGAVNCIKITGNDIVGYNTDVYGFTEAIKPFVRQHHRRALVLGSGGASKAVRTSLQSFGIECVVTSRQTTDNTIPYAEIDRNIIDECRIIVNATPLGMFPATDSYPDIPYQYIGGRHLLFDLIYNPSETLFLKKGRQQGAKTVNGLEMLISQALRAIKIFNIRQ